MQDLNSTLLSSVPAKVPVQDNSSDCGLFVLTYMEFFCFAAPEEDKLVTPTTMRTKSGSRPGDLKLKSPGDLAGWCGLPATRGDTCCVGSYPSVR